MSERNAIRMCCAAILLAVLPSACSNAVKVQTVGVPAYMYFGPYDPMHTSATELTVYPGDDSVITVEMVQASTNADQVTLRLVYVSEPVGGGAVGNTVVESLVSPPVTMFVHSEENGGRNVTFALGTKSATSKKTQVRITADGPGGSDKWVTLTIDPHLKSPTLPHTP